VVKLGGEWGSSALKFPAESSVTFGEILKKPLSGFFYQIAVENMKARMVNDEKA
jgi:hypothetical protein